MVRRTKRALPRASFLSLFVLGVRHAAAPKCGADHRTRALATSRSRDGTRLRRWPSPDGRGTALPCAADRLAFAPTLFPHTLRPCCMARPASKSVTTPHRVAHLPVFRNPAGGAESSRFAHTSRRIFYEAPLPPTPRTWAMPIVPLAFSRLQPTPTLHACVRAARDRVESRSRGVPGHAVENRLAQPLARGRFDKASRIDSV